VFNTSRQISGALPARGVCGQGHNLSLCPELTLCSAKTTLESVYLAQISAIFSGWETAMTSDFDAFVRRQCPGDRLVVADLGTHLSRRR
jgi:hypothetical protein